LRLHSPFTLRIHVDCGPMPWDGLHPRVWPPLSGSARCIFQDGEGWSLQFRSGASLHLQRFTVSSGGPVSTVPSGTARSRGLFVNGTDVKSFGHCLIRRDAQPTLRVMLSSRVPELGLAGLDWFHPCPPHKWTSPNALDVTFTQNNKVDCVEELVSPSERDHTAHTQTPPAPPVPAYLIYHPRSPTLSPATPFTQVSSACQPANKASPTPLSHTLSPTGARGTPPPPPIVLLARVGRRKDRCSVQVQWS
jgi:hypothetical protein